MTADFSEVRPVHSWRAQDLALPEVAISPALEPRITRPSALRFPIEVPRPAVTRVGLFGTRPAVRSFRFQPPHTLPTVPPKPAAVSHPASLPVDPAPEPTTADVAIDSGDAAPGASGPGSPRPPTW